jgi:hypothetical protein
MARNGPASKDSGRRNDDRVQVGSVIAGIAEFNLVGPGMKWHLNRGAGWRAEAVAVQVEFLCGVPIDRDEERSLSPGSYNQSPSGKFLSRARPHCQR